MSRSTVPLQRLFCVLAFCAVVTAQLVAPWEAAAANRFDWRDLEGSSFLTLVRDQNPVSTCWAFGATGALEAKYLITRNDPTYRLVLDLSEQNLVCGTYVNDMGQVVDLGDIEGGSGSKALNYITKIGIVREVELPYTKLNSSPGWPLAQGWENRVVKSTSNGNCRPTDDVARLKSDLKAYGPLCASVAPDDFGSTSLGTKPATHAVLVVGCEDDSTYAGGGYWIIKNSWGMTSDGDYYGYARVAYDNVSRHGSVHAITGQAYYTGSGGRLTWNENSGGFWETDQESWTSGGAPQTWRNGEYSAIFNSPTDPNLSIYVGSVSAHELDIKSGATGYWFAGDKQLLVTGGGIHTQETCTIDCTVALGMTQTWTVAAQRVLIVNGKVKMHINSLTIGGDGHTVLNGRVEDVSSDPLFSSAGLLTGYHPGLTKEGNGTLSLEAANSYSGPTTVSGGTLRIQASGAVTNTSGVNAVNGATLTISGSLSVADNGVFAVGSGHATPGTVVVKDGALVNIGAGSGDTVGATYIGGKIDNTGDVGTGTLTIDGGTVHVAPGGDRPGGDGTRLWLNPWGGSGSTINLNGGTLSTARPIANGVATPAFFNFDGGTLRAALGEINILEAAAPLTVNVRNNGAIIDTNGFDTTIAPALLHSTIGGDAATDGGLTKTGARLLVLTGENTFTGDTTISGGTLQVGNGGTSGVLPGNVTNNGSLAFNRSDDVTFPGTISGTGGLSQLGTGLLILTADNSYLVSVGKRPIWRWEAGETLVGTD